MGYISIFLVSFAIAFSGALAPGPLLAAVISGSLKSGFRAGPLLIAGHALLEIVMVALLVLGLGRFINTPPVIKAISLAGAAILVYFGIGLLRRLPSISLDFSAGSAGRDAGFFLQGITLSLANPYWAVWWLTIGLGLLLSAGRLGLPGLLFFFTGHILADLAWYSFVSFSLSRGRRFVSLKVYRSILAACAAVVISFGLYFGFKAFL
ncbi:MAG TPA: LysE family transporter [bacterium]|uniref:LysE type translocator n=1 Tax=candidate division TA06 bacterium ADurb.Bin417 TaxID=1852828 RepID=A0A1V5MIZ2_UNCT6|nr:MAG: LysE type translocator [candidate division TA06 bacterium ADurb.Bin417]HNQ35559.1 LysE family transporter [bacterium]HNS48825.1 LysE family transporter [bacterium]